MSIDHSQRVDPLAPVAGTQPGNAPPPEDSASFRRLLETLEQLAAEHRQPPVIDNPRSVGDAVAKADEGYSLAMDLRQKLEEAFRQRMP